MKPAELIAILISVAALSWSIFGNAILKHFRKKEITFDWKAGSPYSTDLENAERLHHDTWVRIGVRNTGDKPLKNLTGIVSSIWVGKEKRDWIPCSLVWTHTDSPLLPELPKSRTAFLDLCLIQTPRDNPKDTEIILTTSIEPKDQTNRINETEIRIHLDTYDDEELVWSGFIDLIAERSHKDGVFYYSNDVEIHPENF